MYNIALQWLTEEKKSQGGNNGHEEEEKVKNLYQAMRGREWMQRTKRRRRGIGRHRKEDEEWRLHGVRLKATQSRLPRLAGS